VYEKKNKKFFLSVQLHLQRSCLSGIWRSCLTAVIDSPDISEYGCEQIQAALYGLRMFYMKVLSIFCWMNEDEIDHESEGEDDSEGEADEEEEQF
jgi:hypothetical protein